MTELVEFDDLQQLEALLRAGIELKFELSEDSELLNGSPVFAKGAEQSPCRIDRSYAFRAYSG